MTDKEKESATGTPAENSKTSKAPESTPDAGKKDRLKACLHRVFHRKERDNAHYITTKESNRISRENLRITRMYEKRNAAMCRKANISPKCAIRTILWSLMICIPISLRIPV